MNHIEWLTSLGACREGIEYARTQPNMDAVWSNCPRADWMLWLAGKCQRDKKTMVVIACEIARDILPIFEAKYAHDNRPRAAIEAAERWVRGEATIGDVRAAYAAAAAAYAAAYAAYAADAAAYAVYAAAYAAYAVYAADAAYAVYAADAAADAYAAHAAADAAADARSKALARYADIVRKHMPTAPGPAGALKGVES